MFKGKSWAIFAACAVVATGSLVRAEGTSSASDFTLSKPITAQAAPARKPLMWGLDQVGLAKPLEDAGINIGGWVEASTTFYADRQGRGGQPGRVFDTEDQDPTLNQAAVFVERTVDLAKHEWDFGGRVEFMYGGDARFIHSTGLFDHYGFNDGPDEQFDLVQAYGVIATPWDLKFTIGKFVTPAGYETINPTTTPLYTRGLLFTYLLPFTHTGVVGSYVWGDWTFDLGVIRGWDDALEDKNNDGISVLGRAAYAFADKKTNLYLTGTVGPEYPNDNNDWRYFLDAVVTHKYSDDWSFAGEADVIFESDVDANNPRFDPTGTFIDNGSDSYGWAGGLGTWATWTNSEMFQTNFRVEYLYDGQGLRFDGRGNSVYSAALGWTITPFPTNEIGSNLKIRPELRADYAEHEAFGGGNNWQFSAGIEGYFTF